MKCQVCHEQEVEWSWQPFGPLETPDCFSLPGSHYRGFPIVKVCSSCKGAFQSGDFPVPFEYKGHRYVGERHQVREVGASLWLGESHRTSELIESIPVRALMRDTPEGIDVAALVYEDHADLISVFLLAPRMREALEKINKAFPAHCSVEASFSTEQHLALASARLCLEEYQKG